MKPYLEVRGLRKYFPITAGLLQRHVGDVKAVEDVSFTLERGQTLAIVGESGSGKTTMAKLVARLLKPTAGEVWLAGQTLTALAPRDLKALRRQVQFVYQDPSSSLNPKKRVGDLIAEPLRIHGFGGTEQRQRRVRELLEMVELPPDFATRFPNALSGGQKQRVGIARALALQPGLIILDEPTSALDVSVQAKIVRLLQNLQKQHDLTYLFVTHNLSLVRNFASHVAVMYLGRVVERGSTAKIFGRPSHPYTQALLSAIPVLDDSEQAVIPTRVKLTGEVPSPTAVPPGCAFHTRCPHRFGPCANLVPPELTLSEEHAVACHLYDEQAGGHMVGRH